MERCPYCGDTVASVHDEVAHMERRHPGVLFARLTAIGEHEQASKFAGPRPTDWQVHARWALGDLSDELYAETLAGNPDAAGLIATLSADLRGPRDE